jgi:3-oxoacyl-[acyl-carrier-protein] synthase II
MSAGKTIELKRVVVTGMGALTPLGNTIPEYWNNLRDGVSGCDYITLFDASKFKTRFACEIKGFDATNFLDRKEARKLDRFSQTAIAASDQGVQDAGISKDNVDVDRVGVVIGSGIGGLITFQEEVINFAKGDGDATLQSFLYSKDDIGYCRGTYFYASWFSRT